MVNPIFNIPHVLKNNPFEIVKYYDAVSILNEKGIGINEGKGEKFI